MIPQLPDFGKVSWRLASGVPASLIDLLRGCHQGLCSCVKQNSRRAVYRCSLPDGAVVYLKHDYPRRLHDRFKNLWRLKGRKEFQASCRLFEADIPTPRPLAWGKQGWDTFYVSGELPAIQDFGAAWDAVRDVAAKRRQFIVALGAFLKRILEADVYHPDMHVGNLAVNWDDDGVRFHLLDTYGVRIVDGLSGRQALHMVYWLNGWARRFSDDERKALLQPVAMSTGWADAKEAWRRLMAGDRCAAMRHWPKVRRRLLAESSLVKAFSTAEGRWLAVPDFNPALASQALGLHRQNVAAGHLVKNDVKRRLARIVCEGRKLVVKEYLKPGPFARWRSDRRAWLGALRLWRNGFEVAKPLAWLRSHSGIGYIVFEDAGPDNLPNVLRRAAPDTRRRLLTEAGCLLAGLHNFGVCHGDAKTTNFVVSDDSASTANLTLVDCDAVSFSSPLRESRMHAEVECFRQTIPADVARQEAAAFADAYQAMRIKAWPAAGGGA